MLALVSGSLVGCNWKVCLVPVGGINVFSGAGYYGFGLFVFVAAFAFETCDFAVLE